MNYNEFSTFLPFVSREALDRLDAYYELLKEWNATRQFVQRKTLDSTVFYKRHLIDSLQILRITSLVQSSVCLDIGAGAGLPGIPISIVSSCKLISIEPDQRKAVFLEEAYRKLSLKGVVVCSRAEDFVRECSDKSIDFLFSRAALSWDVLLNVQNSVSRETLTPPVGLYHKTEKQIDGAFFKKMECYGFSFKKHPSMIEKESYIVEISKKING